jgi:hypothetical protein
MRKFTETLKTLAKSAAFVGMVATAGAAGDALSITPAAAQMHGGGGGFHGGGGFGGGGFHGGGFHGGAGAFRGSVGGFRGDVGADRGAFRGNFHRGGWVGGRWYGPEWAGWYGAYPYDNPYGCSYYDYYYGYCDF